MQNAKNLTSEVGYIALPQEAYDYAMKKLKEQKTGSLFKGKSAVGFKIADLTEKEKNN